VPEKDLGLLGQVLGSLAAIAGVWLGIFKFTSLTKDNASFKKEVKSTMNALSIKVESNDHRIDQLEKSIPLQFAKHDAENLKLFPTRKQVDEQFSRQDQLSEKRYGEIVKAHESLISKTNEIAQVLTDMRSTEIKELKEENKRLRDRQ